MASVARVHLRTGGQKDRTGQFGGLCRGGDKPLFASYLEKHRVDNIIIFHFQLVRCLVFAQPVSVKEKADLVHLQALARAVRLHQLLQGGLLLDLEVNNVAILQLSHNKRS